MPMDEIQNASGAPLTDHNDNDKEIDLLELGLKLWLQRKTILLWTGIAIVIGLVVALSIPKEYTVTVKLAPEASENKSGGGAAAALASMAGIGVSNNTSDALYPQLYPDVVRSIPFATGLFDVKVVDADKKTFTVRQYLENETSAPWWNAVLKAPGALLGAFRSGGKEAAAPLHTNNFKLSKEENAVVNALAARISANVDAKTSVITISATMQDPVVAALLADTACARLQEYVTDYRTEKARKDLEYAETLNEEAKQSYYEAQQRYADYLDRNQGIVLHSAQTARERLENEVSLAFNLYNQTAQRLQQAQAKVQATMPVFTVVQPATVPLVPSKPSKGLIIIGFAFLGFVAASAWVLFGEPLLRNIRDKRQKEDR